MAKLSMALVFSDAPIWNFTDIPITDIQGPILTDTDNRHRYSISVRNLKVTN